MTKGVKKGQKKKSTSNAVKAIAKMVRNQPKRKAGRAGKQGARNGVPRAMRPTTGALGLGGGQSGSTNRRQQVIEEDEYVGEIFGSTGFATTAFPINPGQVGTFPWASKIFALYEEYDFTFLEFYYKREVSEFATNGQTGKVILSIDYDASDPAPTTKQQVEDTQAHVDFMPNTPFAQLRADCGLMRRNPGKYVRLGAQPANTDIKTYDAGNLFVSTFGCHDTTVVGELHVRYRCIAKEPVLEAASLAGGAVHFSGTTPTTANNLATAIQQPGGTVALQAITLGTNSVIFPAGIPGNYFISLSVEASTSATALSAMAGGTALNLMAFGGGRDVTNLSISAAATATTSAMENGAFTIPTGGATITWIPSTIVGGAGVDLFVFSLPVSVLTLAQKETAELLKMQRRVQRLERLLELIDAPEDDQDLEEEKYFVPRDIEECHLGASCSAPPPLRRQVNAAAAEAGLAGAIRGLIVRRSNLPVVTEAELPPAKKA